MGATRSALPARAFSSLSFTPWPRGMFRKASRLFASVVAWALPFAFSVTKVGAFLLWLENGHDIILKEGAIPNGIPNFFMLCTPRDFEIFSPPFFPKKKKKKKKKS